MAILPSRGRPNTTLMRKKTFTANVSREPTLYSTDITIFWNVSYGMFSAGNECYKHHNIIKATQ
jgi:hypothetical protein